MDAMQIKEHMDVVGSDGQHVGTVDKLEGQQIKLTRKIPVLRVSITSSALIRFPP